MDPSELFSALRRRAHRNGCGACGALVAWPQHRCPAEHPCADCGEPAEIFVPDPARFPLGALSDEEDYWTGAADVALCDGCVQRRLGANTQPTAGN
jgi:hypothetical protein